MSDNDLPLVSIITPVYNGAKYLPDLIASVHGQDYPNVEHIIIDDGSTDDGATIEVLKAHPHLRWWSRGNRGQYATMNEGLEAAQGEIVCFVSADDVMTARAITSVAKFLTQNPRYAGVYGRHSYIDQNGLPYWYQPLVHHLPAKWYRHIPFIAHCSLYMRKPLLQGTKLYFDDSLLYTSDYDWIIRIAQSGLKIGYLPQILSEIRWHLGQTSNARIGLVKAELLMVWKRRGVHPVIFRIINASIDRLLVAKQKAISWIQGKHTRDVDEWLTSRKGKW